jgi:hypothetical protein
LLEHLDDLLILHSFAYHLLKAVSSLYWTRWIFIYPLWSSMWSAQRGAPKHGSRSSSNQGFFYVLLSSNPSMIQTWYVPPKLCMFIFQMGRAEEFPEPAAAASLLRIIQTHQGLRQILQESALLLDPWSWPLRKSWQNTCHSASID